MKHKAKGSPEAGHYGGAELLQGAGGDVRKIGGCFGKVGQDALDALALVIRREEVVRRLLQLLAQLPHIPATPHISSASKFALQTCSVYATQDRKPPFVLGTDSIGVLLHVILLSNVLSSVS